VREDLKQTQYDVMPAAEQIAVLLAVTAGVFDGLPLEAIAAAEKSLRIAVREELPEVCQKISANEKLSDADREAILSKARALAPPPS
jgi:F-type H+-transporting ATPase subunit alpha